MFKKGDHYKNRRFGFTVTAVLGDRMLVVMENGEKAVLSFELQSRIQNNIKIEPTVTFHILPPLDGVIWQMKKEVKNGKDNK